MNSTEMRKNLESDIQNLNGLTNPDTVKRICSTLCRAALRPARNVAGALLCGLCSCRLLALTVIGE